MRTQIFLLLLVSTLCLANPKMKKVVPLAGLHGMRYFPMVPYNMLGLNPFLIHAPRLKPRPAVVKEDPKPELPAPYVPPPYGDMEKLMGYGGLPMPYGGYKYPQAQ